MVSFRKSLIVMALLAMCATMAMADATAGAWTAGSSVTATYTLSTLRQEGVAELIQPISLNFGTFTTMADSATGTYNFTVSLSNSNVQITSATNEIALVDVHGDPTNDANVYHGTINGSVVTFNGVKVTGSNGTPAGGYNFFSYGLTIRGIRVNATALPSGYVGNGGLSLTVWAVPTYNQAGPASLFAGSPSYTTQTMAYALSAFKFDAPKYYKTTSSVVNNVTVFTNAVSDTPAALSSCDAGSPAVSTVVASADPTVAGSFAKVADLQLTENYGGQFGTIDTEKRQFVGGNDNAVTNATRFAITLTNIPAGTDVYVPWKIQSGTNATTAIYVKGLAADGSNVAGFARATADDHFLKVTAGTAFFYEMDTTSAAAAETLSVPLVVKYSDVSKVKAIAGAVTATAQLAPINSTTSTAIPRFAGTPQSQTGMYNIVACSTTLLFPYLVLDQTGGWDTGIAVSNTGLDPFTTKGQSGTCAMYFYAADATNAAATQKFYMQGTATGAAAFVPFAGTDASTLSPIVAGSVTAGLLSQALTSSFRGYAVAVCDFQYAHGYSFVVGSIQGLGAFSNGYLALVLGQGTASALSRSSNYGQYEQVAQ